METPLSVLLREKESAAVHTVSPDESAYDCAVKLKQYGIGALLVMQGEKLLGIVSERDLIFKIVSCQCDPSTMAVKDIMTKEVVTVSPKTTVSAAMEMVTEKRFRHLPVVENGKLLGVISIGDLTRWVVTAQQHEISSLTSYIQGETR